MKSNRSLKRLSAAATALITAAAALPVYAGATDCLGQNTFDDGIGIPWHVECTPPAQQHFSIRGGTFNATILNTGGLQNGGNSRADCSFVHRGIHIEKNHRYKIHWEVEASMAGDLHTEINDAGTQYNYIDVYAENYDDPKEGVWQNNSKEWSQGWNNVKINRGKNSFDSEFTADRTIENAEWVFQYGGQDYYQPYDSFPEGTTLSFDNMYLECETCGDTFISAQETPCLRDPSKEIGFVSPRSDVRINQTGYYTYSSKKATYATDEEKPAVGFRVMKDGKEVYSGVGKVTGFDEDAGSYCQIFDFSGLTEPGTYTIVADDEDNVYTDPQTGKIFKKYISHEFVIGSDIYGDILKNAMNYYYQNRSGMDISEKYITSYAHSDMREKLAHSGFHEKDEAYIQSSWDRSYSREFNGDTSCKTDVSGGWYTSSNYSKNVPAGAHAVWLLQNMYERSLLCGNDNKWADGWIMNIPQKYEVYGSETDGTGAPDILDEARYELEWMFRMIVDPEKDTIWGEKCEGLVYHEVNDHYEPVLAENPFAYKDDQFNKRIVKPPTYAATFNMIACAAQASRLWRGTDDEFADKCLSIAEASWEAVWKQRSEWLGITGDFKENSQFAPGNNYIDKELIEDDKVDDEAYWAACELYSATGNMAYYEILKSYGAADGENKAFEIGYPQAVYNDYITFKYLMSSEGFYSFNDSFTAALGTLTLWLSDRTPEDDKRTISENIVKAADRYIERENAASNGMNVPYASHIENTPIGAPGEDYYGYEYGSNALIANNSLILAYAYDASGHDTGYIEGMISGMDYLFGRNGLGISYITGCGTYHVNNPSHRYWLNEYDQRLPAAPSGIMVSGPYFGLYDPYLTGLGIKLGTAPQKCYADSSEAWSVNYLSAEWQAAFAWDLAFLELEYSPVMSSAATTSVTTAETSTTTTVSVPDVLPEPKKYGDANCDDIIDMADAVLIMQSLANPDKYAVGGSDENALTKQGASNADVDRSSPGITGKDALRIQKYLLNVISTLDPSASSDAQ